ncbi:MAG: signal peptide peptidase SppA [Deltaproteobacteria bacterium]|nr:signal peptide peptidase SppA [Deltaproteobacteria bacterium]
MKKFLLFTVILLVLAVAAFAVYRHFAGGPEAGSRDNQIGLVNIRGVIIDSREIVKELDELATDEEIKGIIIRINSPGGAVAPSQEIYQEIRQAAQRKPVYSSLGTVAASGGYYIACASQKIYANPGTLTGSIGVIMQFTNWRKILDRFGIDNEVIKSGKMKDIGSPLRAMTPEEKQLLQEMVDDVYRQFLDDVARSRHLPLKKLREIADGRVFSGRQARALGLVDELGSLNRAVNDLAAKVGIVGKPLLVEKKEKKGLLYYLLGERLAGRLARRLEMETPLVSYLLPLGCDR